MKTVFIVNPTAGQGNHTEKLVSFIENEIKTIGADAFVYVTKAVGDAEKYVRFHCFTHGAARFIACGGDGTLSEVVNGAAGFESAEIGVIPIGTGNDFCRNFESGDLFYDVFSQINSPTEKCDAIRYTTTENGTVKSGYCVNMVNIGFDSNVADLTSSMKKKPFISGPFAYFLSIFAMLVGKKGADLQIDIDGVTKHSGRLLLTAIANGSYCGGGVKSNPLASIQDGLININIIKNISRFKFLKLLPYYMKGTFLNLEDIDEYVSSLKCVRITVTPQSGKMRICNDGEIIDAEKTEFEIVPGAFNFVVPNTKQTENNNKDKIITLKKSLVK